MTDHQAHIEAAERKVGATLAHLRGEYQRAARSPDDNTFSWLAVTFFVDQVRHILVPSLQVDRRWERRNGKALITNRLVVAIYIGRDRLLTVRDFLEILQEMIEIRDQTWLGESKLGLFLTLMLVEPSRSPLIETTIWLTVAHAVAQGRLNDNLFDLLPPTWTEVDPAEQPDSDQAGEPRPAPEEVTDRQLALIRAIKPDFMEKIRALLVHHDEDQAMDIIHGELKEYVRAHVFERLETNPEAWPALLE